MADTETEQHDDEPQGGPKAGGFKLGKAGKPIGPFPAAVWVAIIVAGLGIGYLIRRRMGSSSSSSSPVVQAVDPNANGQDHSPGSLFPTVTGPQTDKPTSNSQWVRMATDWLVAGGQPATIVGSGLTKFIQGKPLTSQEGAIVNMAVQHFGWPPEGAPPIEYEQPTTPPPNPGPTPPPVDPHSLGNETLLSTIEHEHANNGNMGPYTAEALDRVIKGQLSVNDPIWKANGSNGHVGQLRDAGLVMFPIINGWIAQHGGHW